MDWISDFRRLWPETPHTAPLSVGHAKQGHPVGGIGEGANLSPEVGGHDPLELGGEAFAEDNEIIELLFGYIHCDPSPAIGIISVCVVG